MIMVNVLKEKKYYYYIEINDVISGVMAEKRNVSIMASAA